MSSPSKLPPRTRRGSPEFKALLEEIAQGSEDHCWQFIDVYGPHIERVVRTRLNRLGPLRIRFDSVDMVQMVWLSFFRDREKITSFETPEGLVHFLITLARNKIVSQHRHAEAARSGDVRRTCSLDDLPPLPSAKSKTPSHLVSVREQVATALEGSSNRDRKIVESRMQGKSFVQIAQELKINERTARRAIWRLIERNNENQEPKDSAPQQ